MIIYNVTSNIQEDVHEEWLDWMQHTHIPEVIATGKFTKARLVRVVLDEPGHVTYSVQFHTDCKANLDKYYEEDANRLHEATARTFGEKVLTFSTELQFISDHKAI